MILPRLRPRQRAMSEAARVRCAPSPETGVGGGGRVDAVDSLTGPWVESAEMGVEEEVQRRSEGRLHPLQQAMRREVEAWTSRPIRVITSAAVAKSIAGHQAADLPPLLYPLLTRRPHGPTNVTSSQLNTLRARLWAVRLSQLLYPLPHVWPLKDGELLEGLQEWIGSPRGKGPRRR